MECLHENLLQVTQGLVSQDQKLSQSKQKVSTSEPTLICKELMARPPRIEKRLRRKSEQSDYLGKMRSAAIPLVLRVVPRKQVATLK